MTPRTRLEWLDALEDPAPWDFELGDDDNPFLEEWTMETDTESKALQRPAMAPLELSQVKERVDLIQQVMKQCMREGQHYGTIPGTDKPTLYKAGAELLGVTFQLSQAYDIREDLLQGGHVKYTACCILTHIPSGVTVSQGEGVCTTLEDRYYWRSEVTGKEVPREYWDTRDPVVLGGPDYSPRKKGGKWVIVHRVPIENPANYWNTCRKMACKRAFVMATLGATGASDVFTQDVEDMEIETPPQQQEQQIDVPRLQRTAFAIVGDLGATSKQEKDEVLHAHLRTYTRGEVESLSALSPLNLKGFVDYLRGQQRS